MPTEATVQQLTDAIYDAAVDQTRWQDVFARLCNATGSAAALFAALYRDRPERSQVVFANIDPQLMQHNVQHYAGRDPWSGPTAHMPAGTLVASDAIIAPAELMKTRYYDEILRHAGILHSGTAVVARDPARTIGVSLLRSPKQGLISDRDFRLLSVVAPHLKRAAQIAWRIGHASALEGAKAALLDHLDEGVFVCDGRGRVLFANRAAEALLALGDGLAASPDGLVAAAAADYRRLRRLIADAAARMGGGIMRIQRPSTGEPFLVFVAPARTAAAWLAQDGPAAIVFVRAPEQIAAPDVQTLMTLFDLTATEAKVALSIAEGQGVPPTAQALRMSTHTVHTHLRRIFAKLGVNRQAELVRVVLSIPLRRLGALEARPIAFGGPVTLEPDEGDPTR